MQLDISAYLRNSETSKEKCLHLDYFWCEAESPNGGNEVRVPWLKKGKTVEDHWKNKKSDFYKIPIGFDFIPGDSANDSNSFDWLPEFSFLLKIPFKLTKPYLSKDDNIFYMLENSLRREKVFKTPMVAASGWKGALRSAMVRQLVNWWAPLDETAKIEPANCERFVSWRIQLTKLFGTERGLDVENKKYEQYLDQIGSKELACEFRQAVQDKISLSGFSSGSLNFYPTFFEKVDIEVITPHDPQTGIPIVGPIYMECVPGGTTGMLTVLYVPSGALVNDENALRSAVAEDLTLLSEGIQAMLTVYGFGAKTSSGFGTADEVLSGEGSLSLKTMLPEKPDETNNEPKQMLRQQHEIKADRIIERYVAEGGNLNNRSDFLEWLEIKEIEVTKKLNQRFDKAQGRLVREENKLLQEPILEPHPRENNEFPRLEFRNLTNLCEQAKHVAQSLENGGLS